MRIGKGIRKLTRLVAVLMLLAGAGALLMSSSTPPFTERDKAYYADEATVSFVRPGLIMKVVSVTIGSDNSVSVRFTLTDPKLQPLDRDGIITPGPIRTSFVLSTIPKGQTQYKGITVRTQTSPITNVAAVQPSADSGGTYTKNADGDYTYKLATKLPADYDKTATHTIGLYGSRDLTEFSLGTNYDDDVYNFVPDGTKVVVTRDEIETATCNKCHYSMGFHGGSRKSIGLCVMCHTAGVIDPDTGNSVDMKIMIHKIHTGKALPSVVAGTPYIIIGNAQSVSDFSKIGFPATGGTENCQVCHETGKGAAQETAYLTRPAREACGSCHDNIDWVTGKNHVDLPQLDDTACATCHVPQGEIDFDASVAGAHVVPTHSSLLTGVATTIVSVDNLKPGQKPTVSFTLTDKTGATVLDASKINRVAIAIAGPTTDYVGAAPIGYIQETASAATLSGSTYSYTFATPIPANAKGTYAVSIEARTLETITTATNKQLSIEFGATNPIKYVSVDGSAVVPRRTIVDEAKCNQCHDSLSLHGENRNQTQYCVFCHNPVQNDAGRRTAAQMPAESIDFAMMIHRIHAGDQQIRDYTIVGFGGALSNYNDVVFPAPLSNCQMCHVTGTQLLPVKAVADKVDPRGLLNPVKPTTGACLACHATLASAQHALANTTILGESCGVCHGEQAGFAISKVHAQ